LCFAHSGDEFSPISTGFPMVDTSTDSAVGHLDDAVIAALLLARSPHLPARDGGAERAALAGLAQHLADDPERLLQRVAEVVRELCAADTVVLAVRETGEHGEEVCWNAVAGGLAGQVGKRWPIRGCPCGASVLADGPVLVARPETRFESIRASGAQVGEALGVPWRVRGHPAGALVAMLDGDGQGFDAHDLQLLNELAGFAAAAHEARGAMREVEQSRIERALAESERRYRMLFEAMDEGFLLASVQVDAGGRANGLAYAEANPAAVRMAGIHYAGPGQLRARVEQDPCWLEACAEVARSGVSTRSQCYSEALSSWFDFSVYPVGGEPSRVAILFHDITERKRAEEALRDADRRKDEFLATLAHELRNPLAPISNAVQLMRRPDGRRQADRVVEMVGRQVRQIVRLVDDLMEVSRITRGKIDLRLERVPIAEVVHGAVETSQLAIERAGHQLALALPDEALVLQADRVRLTQVFANLLNNAAKYTDPGGRIWVDVWRDGAEVAVSVRDTGIGIPPEELPRVFDMFAQVHRAAGRGQGGLGIGLTMVRSLVEMHHGRVEAHSGGSGKGSEFLVRLPLARQDELRLERVGLAQPRPDAPFAGQRILVVDDNRDAADTLGLLLEADGAEVRVVYDGRAAVAMAESFLPASVLLDIGMPGMDGYEVARRLRQDQRFSAVRIVALTGWGQDSDRRQTRNRGFTHHLTKPVSLEELHRILT
jgi:signal transduction histidine kinase/CheY-like chemotaxis protein